MVLCLVIITLLLAQVFKGRWHCVTLLRYALWASHVSCPQVLLKILIVRKAVFIVLLNCTGKALSGSYFLKLILFFIGGKDKTLVTVVLVQLDTFFFCRITPG